MLKETSKNKTEETMNFYKDPTQFQYFERGICYPRTKTTRYNI